MAPPTRSKDARQAIGKLLALSHKQVAPQRFIQARHLELGYAIGIGRRYLHVQCVLHGLAAMAAVPRDLACAYGWGSHPHASMKRMATMRLNQV